MSIVTDAATLERQSIDLIYRGPYVRHAGASSEYVALDLSQHEEASRVAVSRARPIVRPPPSAVTTLSYTELRKTFSRPQRYGPAERFPEPMTESQVLGWDKPPARPFDFSSAIQGKGKGGRIEAAKAAAAAKMSSTGLPVATSP